MVGCIGDKKMAGAKEVVLDASVVVKWFNPEELSDYALELREMHVNDEIQIFAPELLLYEVINALKWNPEFNKTNVLDASRSLVDLMITYEKIVLETSINIAYKYNLTIYDAAYIALAHDLKSPFITADDKLREQAGGEKCVVSLEGYLGVMG